MGLFRREKENNESIENSESRDIYSEELGEDIEHKEVDNEYEDEYSDDYRDEYEEDYADEYEDSKEEKTTSEYEYDDIEESENGIEVDNKKLKIVLDSMSKQGNSLVITGHGGSGKSTIAYNIANMLSRYGYPTLIVDFDTMHRAQSFISKRAFDAIGIDEAPMELAVNGEIELSRAVSLLKKNLYSLSTGLAEDGRKLEDTIKVSKIPEFINKVKSSYSFIICDIPLSSIVHEVREITSIADNILLSVDSSQWGIMSTIEEICNIPDDSVINSIMSTKTSIVFNRYSKDKNINLLGENANIKKGIQSSMDNVIYKLAGEDIGIHFSGLRNMSVLNYSTDIEETWCKNRAYSDTKNGEEEYKKLVSDLYM